MSMSDSRQNEREHIYTRHCIAVDTLQFNAWLMYAVQMDVYTDTICMYIYLVLCAPETCACVSVRERECIRKRNINSNDAALQYSEPESSRRNRSGNS